MVGIPKPDEKGVRGRGWNFRAWSLERKKGKTEIFGEIETFSSDSYEIHDS